MELCAPVTSNACKTLMLRFEAVIARAGSFQLGPLSFDLPEESFWGVLGPSGSGKTKLLEVIAGVLPIESGRVWFGQRDVSRTAPEMRSVGFVYQHALLFPHLNVRNNIGFAFGKRLNDEARRRVAELAGELEIDSLLDRSIGSLSGGEQQRVAIARALFREPDLLLLDEPLSALDDALRQQTMRLFRELHRRRRLTILQSAHSMRDLEDVSGVLRLRSGRLDEQSSTA